MNHTPRPRGEPKTLPVVRMWDSLYHFGLYPAKGRTKLVSLPEGCVAIHFCLTSGGVAKERHQLQWPQNAADCHSNTCAETKWHPSQVWKGPKHAAWRITLCRAKWHPLRSVTLCAPYGQGHAVWATPCQWGGGACWQRQGTCTLNLNCTL